MNNLNVSKKIPLMPSLFVGHGSPMNLVEQNEFTKAMQKLGKDFQPKAILVISAHWLDSSSLIQQSEEQHIIYDFFGFPKDLYDLRYPVKGWDNELIEELKTLDIHNLRFTNQHGLDHGTWAVLYHMYPNANIPVIQLSIPKGLSLEEHFQIGQKLAQLRKLGVMILGSGNLVHNLYKIDWNMQAKPFEWAIEFDHLVENLLNAKKFEKLISIDRDHSEFFTLAHPTPEHYIPLAYALGASQTTDKVSFPCHFMQNGSISMRSVLLS
ncbi:MAG: 4,5-DOPA dioxygenase extradiol [Bdellovibrionaceae bacterium]|nr:4,5-DOPA dioxygenase extradiol [Pseudobdellovibrionaceae bacterium]